MRRDDDIASFAPRQPVGIFAEGVEPIRIDHQRHRRAIDELPDEVPRADRAPEPWTDRDDVARPFEDAIDAFLIQSRVGLRERFGHVLGRHGRNHRLT